MGKTYKKVLSLLLVMVILFGLIGPNIAAFFTGTDSKSDTYTIGQIEVEMVGDDDLYSANELTPNEEYEFTRSVKNIGINDAYVYMTVTIPYDLVYTHDLDGNKNTGNDNAPMDVQLFTYGNEGVAGVNSEWRLVDAGKFDYYTIEEIGDTIKNKADTHGAIRTNMTVTYIYAWVGSNGDTLAKLAPDATTSNLFDTMKFANVSDTDISRNIEATTGEIVTQVYAIQCDNVLESTYMEGNNMDGSEAVIAVWDVINNALVRVNDDNLNKFVVYVGEKHIVRPTVETFENAYGESLTSVDVVSDTALYNELVSSGDYYDISKEQNMDVIAGVVPKASTYGLRGASQYTYAIVAKDNTTIMAPEDISSWFSFLKYIREVNFENMNFSNTTNMNNMFQGSTNLERVIFPTSSSSGGYAQSVTASNMFSGCTNLVETNVGFVPNITQASGIFNDCTSLEELDLSGWEYIDITWLQWLFSYSTTIETIKISEGAMQTIKQEATTEELEALNKIVETDGNHNARDNQLVEGETFRSIVVEAAGGSNTDVQSISFLADKNLSIPENVTTYDVSLEQNDNVVCWNDGNGNITVMARDRGVIYANIDCSNMFSELYNVNRIDISGLNTSRTKDMSYMFAAGIWNGSEAVSSLTSLDVSKLDTSSATNMNRMFVYCDVLPSLDVSNFDTKNVTDIGWMFHFNSALTSLNLSKWDVSNVENMDYLFSCCYKLREINMSNWDTQNVKDMSFMFDACTDLAQIDISSFDTSAVTNMDKMFFSCTKLQAIYVGALWNMSNVTNSEDMFTSCACNGVIYK